MSGGIFPSRKFNWNIKCIIFTLLIAGGYWFLPHRNIYILFFLLWLPYVSMTWYDYSYDCQDKIQPTLFPFGRYIFLPFKPPGYQEELKKLNKEQIDSMDFLDHNVTWILFICLLFYLAYIFFK